MELHTNQNKIIKNINNSKSFAIKSSAKAFKIMSDSLYADKVLAVIREYSTNAYDAHVDANCIDKPFQVHLPCQDEPWFLIRDFGNGMSEDQIMTLFTTYFSSDKSHSNEFVGALGLGSKSAFAYTNAFTVKSYNDGILSTYSCFINEDNIPQVSKMGKKETDESGIEIRFVVKHDDVDEFSRKARMIYNFFETIPTFIGKYKLEIKNPKVLLSGDNWSILEEAHFYSKAYAVQGNISYLINENNLTNLNEKQTFILNNNFRIDFPLGELDVSASRECLSYDITTINNIKEKLNFVFDQLYDIIAKQVRIESTRWLAAKKYFDLTEEIGLRRAGKYIIIIYKGKPLELSFSFNVKYEKYRDILFIKYSNNYNCINRQVLGKDSNHEYIVTPNTSTIFVVKDEVGIRVSQNKARSLVSHQRDVIYISDIGEKPISDIGKKISSDLGDMEVRYTSSIEKLKPVKKETTIQRKPLIPMEEYGYFNTGKAVFVRDIKENVFYIPINRFKPLDGKDKMNNGTFAKFIDSAKALGILDKNQIIYGVLGFGMKQIIKNQNFTNVNTYIHSKLDITFKKKLKDIIFYRNALQAYEDFTFNSINKNIIYAFENNWIVPSGVSDLIFKRYKKIKKRIDRFSSSPKFNLINDLISKSKLNLDFKTYEIGNFANHYPILELVNYKMTSWGYKIDKIDAKIIGEYLALVDGVKS